jgi:hypothetical protein
MSNATLANQEQYITLHEFHEAQLSILRRQEHPDHGM